MNRWSERLLVRRIVAGDQEACVQLVRLHHASVYHLLAGLCHDTHAAEDLTQETFAAAWTGIESFRGSSALASWLHRIAYRKFVDAYRRRPLQVMGDPAAVSDQLYSDRTQPLDSMLAQEQAHQLTRAVARLDPARRAVIVLHYMNDLSYREMAEILEEPVGTIKGRVSEALAKLKILLQGRQEDETGETGRNHNPARTARDAAAPAGEPGIA